MATVQSYRRRRMCRSTFVYMFYCDRNTHNFIFQTRADIDFTTLILAQKFYSTCGSAAAGVLIFTEGFYWNGHFVANPAIVAVGNGTRGAVYAMYAFSELVLDVAPFHLFTFDQPLWAGVVNVPVMLQVCLRAAQSRDVREVISKKYT